jgi:predicted RNase H-like nuclease (RuvC/YqgF family)
MSRRRNYADSEQDQLQRLKHENAKLKRELGKLRRQISKLDLDRFASFKDALDRIDEIEMEQEAKKQEKLVDKNKWKCWDCSTGTLRLKIWDRLDGPHYQRKCDSCNKRTKMKKYEPGKTEE